MTQSWKNLTSAKRAESARAARQAGMPGGELHSALSIRCDRGHHLATVTKTPSGLVFHSALQRHSHGRRDRYSAAHHGAGDNNWFDFLDDDADVGLPAWCACGDHQLSSAAVLAWVTSGERTVVIHG